jgi:hypothetical protein
MSLKMCVFKFKIVNKLLCEVFSVDRQVLNISASLETIHFRHDAILKRSANDSKFLFAKKLRK